MLNSSFIESLDESQSAWINGFVIFGTGIFSTKTFMDSLKEEQYLLLKRSEIEQLKMLSDIREEKYKTIFLNDLDEEPPKKRIRRRNTQKVEKEKQPVEEKKQPDEEKKQLDEEKKQPVEEEKKQSEEEEKQPEDYSINEYINKYDDIIKSPFSKEGDISIVKLLLSSTDSLKNESLTNES